MVLEFVSRPFDSMRHDFLHSQVAIDGEAGGKDEDIYCQKQWEKLNIILYERAEFTF